MARYASGAPVRLSTTVRDTAGVLTTPGGITMQVRYPDGTTMAGVPAPTVDGVGLYHVDLSVALLNQLGHYPYAWVTTGTAAGVSSGAFDVIDPFTPSLLSFEDAKLQLNTTSVSDVEIQSYIDSANGEIEKKCGAVVPRTVVETVYVSGGQLWLSKRPVLSIVSATFGGAAQTITGWSVGSPLAGLVNVAPYGYPYLAYSGTYVVTYRAGRDLIPAELVEAAKLRVQAKYETQRGPADLPLTEDIPGGQSFTLILRARDLEAPYVLPVVA